MRILFCVSRDHWIDFQFKYTEIKDLVVRTNQTFEALNALTARFEELVLRQPKLTISKAQQGLIAEKFASKSLTELNAIVGQLKPFHKPGCPE